MDSRYKLYIKSILEYYIDELFLNEWRLFVVFDEGELTGMSELSKKEYTTLACIDVRQEYIEAHITIYSKLYEFYKKEKYEEVARTLLHELCHIITDELYSMSVDAHTNSSMRYLTKANEQATERISRIFYEYIKENKEFKDRFIKRISSKKKIEKKNSKKIRGGNKGTRKK